LFIDAALGRAQHAREAADANLAPAASNVGAEEVEDVFVARSVRVSTTASPTDFCVNAPFKDGTIVQASYTWSSVATRPDDGRVSNFSMKTIGSIRACFGTTSDPTVLNAYSEGIIAGVPFKGIGSCQQNTSDFPELGVTARRCFQNLYGLPAEYAGGVIVNNSMLSRRPTGEVSDPPGYLQSGLATIRLWRKRAR
jgi:hypothetical protein